jgi:hypothetical protein
MLAGSQIMLVARKWTIKITDLTGAIKNVNNVLYILNIQTNLFFVGKFADLRHLVLFNSQQCYIFKKDKPDTIFLQALRNPRNKLYEVKKRQNLSLVATTIDHATS